MVSYKEKVSAKPGDWIEPKEQKENQVNLAMPSSAGV
jgi:hypothetical protein